MNWFDKLERKYGRYAISNLMFYIIGIYLAGFFIAMFAPGLYEQYLSLDAGMILRGQVWRLVTFMLQPPSYSMIFVLFSLYFYYLIGNVLERSWGAFRFNVYYFSGVLLHIIAAFIIYFIFGYSYHMSTHYINLALFMAFAIEQGETKVYLFFVLPVKMKWLGIIDGVIFAITIIGGYLAPFLPRFIVYGLVNMGFLANNYTACRINATAALVSMLNFLVFVYVIMKGSTKSATQRNFIKAQKSAKRAQKRAMMQNMTVMNNSTVNNNQPQQPQRGNVRPNNIGARHRCAVCGKTELDNDDYVFRYCSKCNGTYEYCQEHLYTHVHVQ